MFKVTTKVICDYLDKQGLDPIQPGYRYIALCLRAIFDGKANPYRAMDCYKLVAQEVGVSPQNVERCIRTVAKSAHTPKRSKSFLLSAYYALSFAEDANANVL